MVFKGKRKMKKKGQMQMSETVAILFIFFVLVFFGIIFYYKYSQVAVKQEKEELLGKRAIETTLKALFLPELICSNGEAEPEDNCFDMIKARHAARTFKRHNQTYFDLFSYSKITLHQVYPEFETSSLGWEESTDQEVSGDEVEQGAYTLRKVEDGENEDSETDVFQDNGDIILYDKPRPNWERRESTYFVVALRDQIKGLDYYGFGYLQVEVYS